MGELRNHHKKDPYNFNNNLTKSATVSITKVYDYDYAKVYEAIEKCLELIGGLNRVVQQGQNVFVKINHLSPPSPAERGIVTHPIFIQAVLDILKKSGANITVGDDIDSYTGDGFLVSGIRQVCEKVGIKLINLREEGFVEIRCDGSMIEKVYISRIVRDSDVIINLPKLKTHSLTVYTGGIKNMYGIIPKGNRTKFHYDYMRVQDFSQMLTDIFSVVKPRLNIMDGIIAMEGEGPGSGSLRNLGIVLASLDTVALDAVATKIIGLDPLSVSTTKYAHERGLGIGNIEDIEIVGAMIEDITVSDFRLPASYSGAIVSNAPTFLARFLLSQMTIKPKLIKHLCTGCFECKKICPSNAISIAGEKVSINQGKCIHCMCCHEVCRFNAITPRRSLIGSSLSFIANILRKITAILTPIDFISYPL